MAAIAKILSRASRTEVEVETLKTIAMFCGVGLLVSLLFATYGLDLSVGFFWEQNSAGGRDADLSPRLVCWSAFRRMSIFGAHRHLRKENPPGLRRRAFSQHVRGMSYEIRDASSVSRTHWEQVTASLGVGRTWASAQKSPPG
jgi:hypothetical protein